MQDYTETILKYASDDTRTGILKNADGTGEVGLSDNEVGSRLAVRFTLHRVDQNVGTIRYQVFGCGFTIAACAAAAEIAEGLPLEEVNAIDAWAISHKLNGLPEERSYCAKLASQALQAAITSAQNGAKPVSTELLQDPDEDHTLRINRKDPLYRALLKTAVPPGILYEDRQMFAGLLTLATQENKTFAATLGLKTFDIDKIFAIYFPNFDPDVVRENNAGNSSEARDINQDVLNILLSHVARDQSGKRAHISEMLCRIIAARAVEPGHLWVAMGFLERPQLTSAICRHLPTLAIANDKGMRWKRYLFKQVCDMNGGVMCKSPNCGDCSDYHLCFEDVED